MARFNTTRRGNIPLVRCTCAWHRVKKRTVYNNCPFHKPRVCRACKCTNAPGEGKCDDCGRDL